jgi:hypothetical protein
LPVHDEIACASARALYVVAVLKFERIELAGGQVTLGRVFEWVISDATDAHNPDNPLA